MLTTLSKDVLGLRFVTDVLSVKVSVVLQVDVALNFSFLLERACTVSYTHLTLPTNREV